MALPIVAAAVLADVLAWQPVTQPDREPSAAGSSGPAPAVVPAAPVAAAVDRDRATRTPTRRLTPDQIRSAAGRTTAGLGSHPRRRYGAWDWSSPEWSGTSSTMPPARNGAEEAAAPVAEDEPVSPGEDVEAAPEPAAAAVAEPDVEPAMAMDPEPAMVRDAPQEAPECRTYGVLEFSDGQVVEVGGPVIIGRAPSQAKGVDRPARLVAVAGSGRGISRNHVRIDVGLNGPFVVDLGSRNGSTLRAEGREPTRLDAWMPYPLLPGMRLTFADASCVLREP